ncbi:MAG: UDP-N-acetylmuramoyl-tripeptide--D-alanyl-D-alanine ligase [Erysipelotrichaceae bacterium]|nr:UDP-N-acetylmuramoyl-tripeptide--D-alanyl-D-alanine ligase [Erysipelotrichaceae bacterium]
MKGYEIIAATNGMVLAGDINEEFIGITQDSRLVQPGNCYVAIAGENVDGHDFVEMAIAKGAKVVLVSNDGQYSNALVIKVDDVVKALGNMAHYLRVHNDLKVIGVTGSVGKTSTRDLIANVVSQKFTTLATKGNYNNELGLPLTMLNYNGEEVMVLEMGMNHENEISYLSKIAQLDVACITNVGTAHIGNLGSRENILKAKCEIMDGNIGALLIVNGDNDLLRTVKYPNYLMVGFGPHNDYRALNVQSKLESSEFDLILGNQMHHFVIPTPGEHYVANALIAVGVGLELGIDIELIKQGIATFKLTKNRHDIIKLEGLTIIDGSYNSSTDSLKASLKMLAAYKNRKIAVIGDMLELGEYSRELHKDVGDYLNELNIDIVYTVGKETSVIQDSYRGVVYHFDNNEELLGDLIDTLEYNDVVLIKGSNSMKLKNVVEGLVKKYGEN